MQRWEREILRRIFGAVETRTIKELKHLYQQPDIINKVKSGCLQWLGHVHRMEDTRFVKKGFQVHPETRRQKLRTNDSVMWMRN